MHARYLVFTGRIELFILILLARSAHDNKSTSAKYVAEIRAGTKKCLSPIQATIFINGR